MGCCRVDGVQAPSTSHGRTRSTDRRLGLWVPLPVATRACPCLLASCAVDESVFCLSFMRLGANGDE